MGLLEGWLTGYGDRRHQIATENLRQAENAMARENDVFKMLLNSPDDEVRAMAATGLITGSQPQKPRGGLRGWFGEMESNPAYPTLLKYLQTPKQIGTEQVITPTQPAGFRYPTSAGLTQLPSVTSQNLTQGQGAAALPETSPTEAGSPGVTPTQAASAPRPAPGAPVPGAWQGPPLPEPPWRPRTESLTPSGAPPAPATAGPEVMVAPAGAPEGVLEPAATFRPGQPNFGQTAADNVLPAGPPQPPFKTEWVSNTLEEQPVIGLPQAFPTQEQTIMAEARGRARGAVAGKVEEYTEMFRRIGLSEVDARKKAAELFANEVRRQTSQGTAGQWVINAARELYGMSPEDVAATQGPEGYQRVLQRADELAGRRSYNTVRAGGDARYDNPIDVRTAAQSGTQVGLRSRDYGGNQIATPAERTRLQSAQSIKQQLTNIKGMLGVLPKQADVFGGTFTGWANWLKQRLPWEREQVARLQSAVSNIQALLTRTMQGNVGTQTEQDAARALQSMIDFQGALTDPTRGDTQESAAARLDETLAFLDSVVASLPPLPQPNVGTPPPSQGGFTAPPASGGAPGGAGAGGAGGAPAEAPPPGVRFWTSPSGAVYVDGKRVS